MLNQPRHYSAKGEVPTARNPPPISYAEAYGLLENYRRVDGSIKRMDIPNPERTSILLKLQSNVRQSIRDYLYGGL